MSSRQPLSIRLRSLAFVLFIGSIVITYTELHGVSSLFAQSRDSSDAKVREQLQKRLSIDFNATPLSDVVAFLAASSETKIQLDSKSLAKEGIPTDAPVTLNLHDVTTGSILKLILREHQATYMIRDNVVLITTRAAAGMREEKVAPKILKEAETKIQEQLKTPCDFEFADVPLADAIHFLRDLSKQNIVLDHQGLKQAGIAPDSPVSIRVANKSMDAAIKQMLGNLKATYVIEHEVIIVKPIEQQKGNKLQPKAKAVQPKTKK